MINYANSMEVVTDSKQLASFLYLTKCLELIATTLENKAARQVTQTLGTVPFTLKAPYRVGEKLVNVTVTAVLAREEQPPAGVEPIEWLMLTSLPATPWE